MLDNLLTNAAKFSAPGTAVHVRLQAVAGSAELTIADHGQGIEPDFLPHIFERFQQQDRSTTRMTHALAISPRDSSSREIGDSTTRFPSAANGAGERVGACPITAPDSNPAVGCAR